MSIKEEFEKAWGEFEPAIRTPHTMALFGAKWMAERCAKEIDYQALEEKYISLPSHSKNDTVAIDNLIGAIISERVAKIRQLAKELN